MHNHLSIERKFLISVLVLLFIAPVFADHTASVTINPDIANCNELGNTFTVTIENDANSSDSIWTVDIYESVDVTNFSCGPAPAGWHLDTPTSSLCRYTATDYSYYISNGSQLNFTFDAVMNSSCQCLRSFHVATLDNQTPTGQYQHNYPSVNVDCNAPDITKVVGTPKLLGDGFDWWITQNTQIDITGSDSKDTCDLGMDYCRWRYRVDNGTWIDWKNHTPGYNGNVSFTISFSEDSVHDIQIECYDIAGNKATLEETDKVDSTPPETNKTYGMPFYSDGTYDWITNSTPIDLTATDGGNICAIGVDKLYYRVTQLNVPDSECIAACDFNGVGVLNETNENHIQFTIDEDSCHLIEFYAVDKLGNTEEINKQCVFVDNKPPVGTKTIGDPKKNCTCGENCDYWVSQNTPITLTCTDQQPHPVDNEKVCYKIYVDNNDKTNDYCDHNLNSDGYCCENKTHTLKFKEDSNHTLEYYCEDALGNRNEVDIEKFRVDNVPPIINKTIIGPQVGDCPPEDKNDKCWIKNWTNGNGTTIHIDAYDNDTLGCAIDQITCDWWYVLDDNQTINNTDMQGLIPPFNITFYDETEHELHVECCDALGNCYEDIETFYVDSSGPNVSKEFIGPWYRNQSDGVEWIDTVTKINLTAHDNPCGECAVDNSTIYWKDFYFPDADNWSYCYQDCAGWVIQTPQDLLNPLSEGWNKYERPFNDLNESCHVLEYYAVDALGNVGPIGVNCFFSDHTKPVANLTVGIPSIECENKSDCDYWVKDHKTQIYLDCENVGPHPSPLDKIQWRIWDDITGNWTEWNESQAGVCGYDVTIVFNEDSVHKIQYKCNDTVGKETDVKEKVFRVDSTPPTINKTMLGIEGKDWNGSCPPENTTDICYVRGGSGISVIVYDPDPTGKGCAVDNINCSYEVWWNNTLIDTGTFTNSTEIKFNEDSAHDVIIYCEDALGNYIQDEETFLVDKKPPVTIKTYGEPKLNNGTHLWITSSTPINLTATDYKIGVDYIKYRVTYIGNETCLEVCDYNGTGNWTRVYGNFARFTINEDSCHLIEYHAVDKFGNNETIHKQCVMVDNTPPTPNKIVGKPKEIWDGKDAKYYDIADKCWSGGNDSIECWKVTTLTPISLKCFDQEPHPVNHNKVCFRIELNANKDKTEDYCKYYHGMYNKSGNGFCCIDEIGDFLFREECEHNLEYYCVDGLGNTGPVDEEKFKVEGTKFEIPLKYKWNLISVPFVLLNNKPEEVFNGTDVILSVWTYDSINDEWLVYTPGEGPDTLDFIDPGWGYWVLTTGNDTLVLGGYLLGEGPVTPPDRRLKSGWNLIGYYGTQWELYSYFPEYEHFCGIPYGEPEKYIYGGNAYCSLISLTNKNSGLPYWNILEGYLNCGDGRDFFYPISSCAKGFESDTFFGRMYAGHGYWIHLPYIDGESVEYLYSPAMSNFCIWPFEESQCIYPGYI